MHEAKIKVAAADQDSKSLGKVSHLFHGIIKPETGLVWCRLEIFRDLMKEPISKHAYRSLFPRHGATVAQIDLIDRATTVASLQDQAELRGGWSLKIEAPHTINGQNASGNWFRGFYAAFEFTTKATSSPNVGQDFADSDREQKEIIWKPAAETGSLSSEKCEHGERILVTGGSAQEFLHDSEEYWGSDNVVRFEKQSTQNNSLLYWALESGHAAAIGAGATHGFTIKSPHDPTESSGRVVDGKEEKGKHPETPYSFTCGGKGNTVEALHFMEAGGLFRHLPMPSLSEIAGMNHPMLLDKAYWRHQFGEVLEGVHPVRGGEDLPHECVTLILK